MLGGPAAGPRWQPALQPPQDPRLLGPNRPLLAQREAVRQTTPTTSPASGISSQYSAAGESNGGAGRWQRRHADVGPLASLAFPREKSPEVPKSKAARGVVAARGLRDTGRANVAGERGGGVEIVLTARGKDSGVPVELRFWGVFCLAEGKIARRQVFWIRDEALEAVGLRE